MEICTMSSGRDIETAGTMAAWKAYLDFVRENYLPPNPTRDLVATIAARWIGCKIAMLHDQVEHTIWHEHSVVDQFRVLEHLLKEVQRISQHNSILQSRILLRMAIAAHNNHKLTDYLQCKVVE
jgi:hypothetical protein